MGGGGYEGAGSGGGGGVAFSTESCQMGLAWPTTPEFNVTQHTLIQDIRTQGFSQYICKFVHIFF